MYYIPYMYPYPYFSAFTGCKSPISGTCDDTRMVNGGNTAGKNPIRAMNPQWGSSFHPSLSEVPLNTHVPGYSYGSKQAFPATLNAYPFNAPAFTNGWERIRLQDYGNKPYVVNIEEAAEQNRTFRTAIWTGKHLQVTLMSIEVGDSIGLEVHPTVDQFLRIEEGQGIVQMGSTRNNLSFQARVFEDDAIMVPAGMWHNVTNTGNKPLKLYSIYAPPEHPFGTVHETKADAMAAERNI